MRFLLLVALWSTLAFIPAWFITTPYQHALAAAAAKVVAPPGTTIEIVDFQLFFPFDLGIYVALCLASTWAPWPRRGRAIAIGLPLLVLIELISVSGAMKSIMAVMANPNAPAEAGDRAVRFATGIIRVSGLVAAAVVWLYGLGRERLSLAARTWLGA